MAEQAAPVAACQSVKKHQQRNPLPRKRLPVLLHPRPIPPTLEQSAFPSSSAAQTSCLSLDILVLILGLLPLPGRLRVCALVCKRWRWAAARTIESITVPFGSLEPIFSVYPCLTELTIAMRSLHEERLIIPSSIRKIVFAFEDDTRPLSVPAPTALSCLVLIKFSSLPPVLPWLTQLRTSLTKLCVRLPFPYHLGDHTAWASFLREWHLPALTRLRLTFNTQHKDEVPIFLERHSSQLSSLDLTDDIGGLILRQTTLTFPSLRKLRFEFINRNTVCTVIHASPRLESLQLHSMPEDDVLLLLQIPKVQATLTILEGDHVPHPIDLILACTRLKSLPYKFSQDGITDPQCASILLTRLTDLIVTNLQAFVGAANGICMSLQTLIMNLTPPCHAFQHITLQLPHLTCLDVKALDGRQSFDLKLGITQVRYLVDSAPCLRVLVLRLDLHLLTTRGVDGMIEFVRDMAARKIGELNMMSTPYESPRLLAVLRSLTWTRVLLPYYQRLDECEAQPGEGSAWTIV